MDIGQIWWNHIIKPNYFLKSIIDTVLGGKSLALFLPEVVPWYDMMIELVKEELRKENPIYAFDAIGCPASEAGQFLLEKYCSREKQAAYRYGLSYAEFLGKSKDIILHNRYIWVRNVGPGQYEEWTKFIADYHKAVGKYDRSAVFILEVTRENVPRTPKKGIELIVYENTVTEYDRYTFCALLAAEVNCRSSIKQYLSELSASICGNDVELCSLCVHEGRNFLADPVYVLERIIREKHRSDGTDFQLPYEPEQINKIIWECHIKLIFPRLENYRSTFVARHENAVKQSLPIHNPCGDTITMPQDVELGMLIYLVGIGAITVEKKEYEKLDRFRKARNKLAHLNCLEIEEVEEIL